MASIAQAPRLLLSELKEKTRTESVVVDPKYVNVIRQVRSDAEEGIEDMVDTISAQGQQTRGAIVAHTPDMARQHLELFNTVFGTAHTLDDLVPIQLAEKEGKPFKLHYLFLIFGHRRLLAIKIIEDHFAKRHLQSITIGKNYVHGYRADVHFNLTPFEALKMQINENRYRPVSLMDDVFSAWHLYRLMRIVHEGYSPSELARDIGRRPDWVRDMLRYCALPPSIQAFVDGDNGMPKISYSKMNEITRLAHGFKEISGRELPEEVMLAWIRDTIVEGLTPERLADRVSAFLRRKQMEHDGQGSLFAEEPVQQSKRRARKIAAQASIKGMMTILGYMEEIKRLVNAGVLGSADHPLGPELDELVREDYAPGSPTRMLLRVAERLSGLAPQLNRIVSDPKLRITPGQRERLGSMELVLRDVTETARKGVELEEANGSLF